MIYLIRHGRTALNAAAVIQHENTPLDEHGSYQADQVAERLTGLGVARVLASDLPRAVMTAEPIARATGGSLELTPLLRERNFGDDRGTPYRDLRYDIFASGYQPPGGEGEVVFDRRVREAWRLVADAQKRTTGNVAIVTHGLVCRSLCSQCLTLAAGTAVPDLFGNTSVTTVEPVPPHHVRLLDCAAHLDPLKVAR